MIGDKVIVEGVSKTGRTAYVNSYVQKMLELTGEEYKVVSFDNLDVHDYITYRDLLFSSDNIVFDGFCYAQFVYKTKEERGENGLTIADLLLLEDIISEHKFDVYYVHTDANNVFQNTQKDNKYSYYTMDYIKALQAKYEYLFDTVSTIDVQKKYLKYKSESTQYTLDKIDIEQFDYSKLPHTVAVEFDDVIAKNAFPNISVAVPNYDLIERIKLMQSKGTKFILWTKRTGQQLINACNFCAAYGIYFDAINNNIDEVRVPLRGGSKKVWASEYWDTNVRNIVF